MTLTEVLVALATDTQPGSKWAHGKVQSPTAFLAGFGWIRADGSSVSGGTVVRPRNLRPGLIGRWRIRRAVRAWAKRRRCHLEGHDVATFRRKGRRRSDYWAWAVEDVTQTREQCRRCGEPLTDWADVEDSVRGFSGYTAPADIHERVMYGGGDWGEPREVRS